MEPVYTVEELQQMLDGLDNIPFIDPSLLDASLHPPHDFDLDLSTLPPLPDVETIPSTPESDDDATRLLEERVSEFERQIGSLQQELESLTQKLAHLVSYLTNLHPWMVEVSEALEDLGDAPKSATDLEFREK